MRLFRNARFCETNFGPAALDLGYNGVVQKLQFMNNNRLKMVFEPETDLKSARAGFCV
jgi:hypothetical protein